MTAEPRDKWSFLGSRVVMVSRFPPARDGIARYAQQMVEGLRDRHQFVRIGTLEGGGDRRRALHTGIRALKLLRDTRGETDIVVQYHPHYYVRGGFVSRLASYASWGALARRRPLTVVVHEPDEPRRKEIGRRGRAMFAVEEGARRWFWQGADRLAFHSDWERRRHAERFGRGPATLDVIVSQSGFLEGEISLPREEARCRLGLTGERVMLLLIGFFSSVQPDKGYDRVLAAMRELADPDVDLWIVGSPIREAPEVDRLVEDLREAARTVPGVNLREGFVDDEDFDLWIRAADVVITPYRTSSSSAVLARAQLLGTRVLTSDVGGLGEQAGPGDVIFGSDEELVGALRQVVADAAGRLRR